MARRSFRNLKEIEKYIQNNIPSNIIRGKELQTILKGTMNQAIYDVVYGHYLPKKYERRRGNGGLGDTRVMQITNALMDGNTFKIIFENLATGNDTLKGHRLDDTIINGLEENWQQTGVWSEPRDFISETMNLIQADPSHLINAVKKAFIKAGFKVK